MHKDLHRHGLKVGVAKSAGPNSEINVTPLVDVVLVLLIIFMVVTPLLEKDIDVRVPTTEEVPEQQDVPQDQIVVSLSEKGEIAINRHVVDEKDFVPNLRDMLHARAHSDRLVFVNADDKANYGKLVSLLDGAKQAGAETLGMMTDEAELPSAAPAGAPAPASK